MIVVDASVLAIVLCDDTEAGDALRSALAQEDVSAPELVDIETTSVIRKSLRAGFITNHRAALAMVDLIDLPIERVPHQGLLHRMWQLHEDVTPYDAAYVALAELLSAPLWTADAKLSRAPGIRCSVHLISTS